MHLREKQYRVCESKSDTMKFTRHRRSLAERMNSPLRLSIALLVLVLAEIPAVGQISFTTAVDLALKNSPRVKAAEADVAKAQAALEETKDVYIPSLVVGAGLGYSYGFPLGQPSVFNFTSQSLVFNFSQQDYIRAARASLNAANLALRDARQAVAEDAAITYLALHRDQERQAALVDQSGYAGRLVGIVQDRLNAGQDTPIDLTTARLTEAQIRLTRMRAEDDTEADRTHLARLTGLPATGLSVVPSSIPQFSPPPASDAPSGPVTSPSIESAYAVAKAKQQIAFGDARYLWRPQIYFVAQYSLFAKFNNYDLYYNRFQYNNAGIGVDIKFPVFDAVQRAKSRESAAEASRAQHEANAARDQFLEGRLKVRRATAELAARAEVASLDQQLAEQQLDVMLVQLNGTGNSSAQQMTPKDEQNSRIAEREKYLAYLDAGFQMKQAQINLMRQTGDLETWLKSAVQSQPQDASKPQ
jgi:outer membrane protein TolC